MRSRSLAAILALLSMACGTAQTAVSDKPETPFKLATYEGRVGLVLGETLLDIGAANEHLVREAGLPALEIPTEMRALIESYDRVKPRLYQMANFFNGKTDGPGLRQGGSVGQDRGAYPVSLESPDGGSELPIARGGDEYRGQRRHRHRLSVPVREVPSLLYHRDR